MLPIDLPLKEKTPPEWVQFPLKDFPNFLLDHASCERKAAALAMSFLSKYADKKAVIEPMVCLAREELEHFHEVWRLVSKRGLEVSPYDEKDPYVTKLMGELRHGRDERFLDRLLMSALIEARGYERFLLLADALEEPELKDFYRHLAEREAGHYMIFLRIARHYFSDSEVSLNLERMSQLESKAMLETPFSSRLH
jgi:tRNA-(ms[2]io[6]A)-hydroxylase